MKFKWKKYLYILHDVTSLALQKERAKEDKRVRNLTIALIIAIIILIASLFFNVYLVTGAYLAAI